MILGCLAERSDELVEQRLQALDRFDHRRRPLLGLRALARPAQRILQVVQMPIERLRERRGHVVARTAQRAAPRRHRATATAAARLETAKPRKLRRDLRQLMRFVDDDRVGARQQVAEALLLEHEVRHQQVMIDDDDVGRLRVAPRLHDVATIERRAFRAEAVVARRGHPRPHRIGIAELRELGDVALPRRARPVAHFRQAARDFLAQAARSSLLLGELEPMHAQVVRAALQQRDAHRPADRARDRRQIAMEQLVLQLARAGGDDHAPAGEQRGHEIRERLAGAGARLDDQPAMRAQRERTCSAIAICSSRVAKPGIAAASGPSAPNRSP